MASTNYTKLNTELEGILTQLQNADLDIDTALKLYKKGQALVEQLEQYLKSAENTLEKLTSEQSNQ